MQSFSHPLAYRKKPYNFPVLTDLNYFLVVDKKTFYNIVRESEQEHLFTYSSRAHALQKAIRSILRLGQEIFPDWNTSEPLPVIVDNTELTVRISMRKIHMHV